MDNQYEAPYMARKRLPYKGVFIIDGKDGMYHVKI